MTSSTDDLADHQISLAVWDMTSPVVAGRRAKLKVGVACSSGCDLTGTRIDVHDETGTRAGGGSVGPTAWPATNGLYWVELDVPAPGTEGDQSFTVRATAPQPPHGQAATIVRFVASAPPEHHVTLEVIDKGSGAPVPSAELRVGRWRATTDDSGVAHVEVPGGTYEVAAWKLGYDLVSNTIHITGDTTIRLDVTPVPHHEQPYWM